MSYIKQSCSDSIVGKYALQCHKHLTKTRATSRKNMPSMSEIMVSLDGQIGPSFMPKLKVYKVKLKVRLTINYYKEVLLSQLFTVIN